MPRVVSDFAQFPQGGSVYAWDHLDQAMTEGLAVLPPDNRERLMPELNHAISDIPDIYFAPACLHCTTQMQIVGVTLADASSEDRTFRCPKCHYVHTWIFRSPEPRHLSYGE
jgi:hypothetical protein